MKNENHITQKTIYNHPAPPLKYASMSAQNIVIVESPAKAKTIEKYLGSDYHVVASYGHIRDLPKTGMSIDIENGFIPKYEVSADKKKTVNELKRITKNAKTVWLASDPDREGEAIAWHLYEALGLKPNSTKRIVFREITKPGIDSAVANPRTVDQNLVDAQQARRVLDRLVGYELSPVLWKKVRPGLSAGRVQSVAVRLIVEREREIENFKASFSFRVTATFDSEGKFKFKAEHPTRFKTEAEAQKFLESLINNEFAVSDLTTKPAKRSPTAPFTTSTLQQEASRKLGFSVKQTMVVAQRLYESGHITYMRTDSLNLSQTALAAAEQHIKKEYGAKYAKRRTYKTKSAGAQEAHEAIRPTNFEIREVSSDRNEQRLYDLIFKRATASQMADAELERSVATITADPTGAVFTAKGEIIKFDGFLKVYFESRDHEEETEESGILPPIKTGQVLNLDEVAAKQIYDRPKPRYTEASLVKALEEMGIGRPSTYAPTISTIQDRQYVEKGDIEGKEREIITLTLKKDTVNRMADTEITGADQAKLVPTPVGSVVSDFLVKFFPDIVDYQFTAKVEDEFDEIERGSKPWNAMISEFYGPFHKTVESAEGISRQEASQAHLVGKDPKTGKPIIARLGRYGPMLQIGEAEDEEKPRFAPLPAGKKMETVTLEEALEYFALPRTIGQTEDGQDIQANFGRFGPYIKVGKIFVSIKPDDPFSITLERARELYREKLEAEEKKHIKSFEGSPIQVVNGRYGPYITDGKKNAKIPKDKEPADLTLKECQELIKAAPTKKPRRKIVK